MTFGRVLSPLTAANNTQRKPAEGIMVNFAAAFREHWVNILVPLGFVIGVYLDRRNDQKLTAFRNKSALYSRELKPGEQFTWK
ncbi:NADH dehydrogenase [ubiquinone] 1 beta subcomplex subunit 1-like isoform X1 [Myxocyprinus asiaticus]|uniref:NADH dehydrogenase [ubiquinone] 1 beta subcomplex subunit 1-like isoform X1 n=2 Tax=Myxocyprinus asiaticus TaxID=70543 RepID=UPI002221F011|nr:NADH dehydrogenase [ubiquinone] 1 beta subcomplex subunit 1-like isoform X1 [Myxocyprinus asiaticus]